MCVTHKRKGAWLESGKPAAWWNRTNTEVKTDLKYADTGENIPGESHWNI